MQRRIDPTRPTAGTIQSAALIAASRLLCDRTETGLRDAEARIERTHELIRLTTERLAELRAIREAQDRKVNR